MAYYWRGELSLADDDLIAPFFNLTNDDLSAHALDWVGQVLFRSDAPPSPEASQRLRELWEWRDGRSISKKELQTFGWWFASRRLDEDWSFTVLENVLDNAVLPEPDHLVVQTLADLSASRTAQTVRCLDNMISLASGGWSMHGWLDTARTILEAGLESSDQETRDRADRVVNRLGALGFRDFRQLFKRLRNIEERVRAEGSVEGTTGV